MSILLIVFILSQSVSYSQSQIEFESKPPNRSVIGIDIINANLSGEISPFDKRLQDGDSYALYSFESSTSFGINYAKLRKVSVASKWSFMTELGFYYIKGNLQYRSQGGSTTDGSVFEVERRIKFNRYYAYSALKFNFDIWKKGKIAFSTGPRLAAKIKSSNQLMSTVYLVDYSQNPVLSEVQSSKESNQDGEEFSDIQLYMTFGLSKTFDLPKGGILIGVEYQKSFLRFNNAGPLSSNPIVGQLKYIF